MSPRDLALLINYCSCLIPQRPPRASLSDTPPLPLVALPPTPSRARSEACASQIQNWKNTHKKTHFVCLLPNVAPPLLPHIQNSIRSRRASSDPPKSRGCASPGSGDTRCAGTPRGRSLHSTASMAPNYSPRLFG